MAQGSTEPLTEMSTRNLPGVRARPGHAAVWILDISLPSKVCYGDSFTFRVLREQLDPEYTEGKAFTAVTVNGCDSCSRSKSRVNK
jgi:hypothetical protein